MEPPPDPRREGKLSWLVRALFVVLAIALATTIGEPAPPTVTRETERAGDLVLLALAVRAVGRALPWRWLAGARLRVPGGPNLALVSKLVGWSSAPLFAAVAAGAPWWLALLGCLGLLAALGLWLAQPWAAPLWSAFACAPLAFAAWGQREALLRGKPVPILPIGSYVGLALFLALETRAWQLGSREERS